MVCRYGQELTVSGASFVPAVGYMTTEAFDPSGVINKDTCQTRVLLDVVHIPAIADALWKNTPGASANIIGTTNQANPTESIKAKYLVSAKATYRIRNQSNEPVWITAYFCKCRKDYRYVEGAAVNNIYGLLSRGFATNGKDSGNVTADNNAGMTDQDYTPFQSNVFCEMAKILRKKRFKITPGAQHFEILKMKEKWINMMDYAALEGTTAPTLTWVQWTRKYDFSKHARFILFRVESNPAGLGTAQPNYSKQISHTTPTVIMDTQFVYSARMANTKGTGMIDLEFDGYTAPGTGSTIISYNAPALTTEQDAV